MSLAGKVFVVTGGGNGIGREAVLELIRRGARVAAVDLSADGLAETARLADAGEKLSLHEISVADRAAVEALPAQVTELHGKIDGIANVAGIVQHFTPVKDLPVEEIEKVMNVNFYGVVYMCKAFLPHLLERPRAALLNVSSMGALVPVPGQSAYGASKSAVKLFTEGLYAELMDSPVKVTVVFPGAIETNIVGNSGVSMPGQERTAADTKMKMTKADVAGKMIVDALEKGTFRVCIGSDAKLLDRLSRYLPKRSIAMIAKKMKSLVS